MKKLTTPAGVFGPYSQILTLPDRYRCDGAELPLSVVGVGTISDWTDPLPTPSVNPAAVPEMVSMRQARLALLGAGLLSHVNDTLAAMPGIEGEAARIEWEFAADVQRNWPLLVSLIGVLGITDEQVDSLFVVASKL